MSDEPTNAQEVGMRLLLLMSECRALLGTDPAALPPPVAFALGDALEALETATAAAGHVGLMRPGSTPVPATRAEACRRLEAVRSALLDIAIAAPAAARVEIAVAISGLDPWVSTAAWDSAERDWAGHGGTVDAE